MMQQINRKLFFSLIIFFMVSRGYAQNMNSPYSIYGIGDLDFRPYNRTSGMGGTGLALSSSFYLIDNNPAAIAGLTRSFFIVDAAGTGKIVNYSGSPINAENSKNKDFWIKRVSFAVKLNKFWASSIGYNQFSNVNYLLYGNQQVEGSQDNYFTYHEGDGGLNEYFWTNAVSLGKHFSLGLRSSMIVGSINQTATITDAGLASAISTKITDYIAKPRFQAGFIYDQPISKKWDVSLGGKYIPQVNMNSQRTLSVFEGTTSILDNEFMRNDLFKLPTTYAAGIAVKHNDKTTYAVDYTYEDWSALQIKEQGWQLISSNRLSAGVQFSKLTTVWNQKLEKRYFQLGGFVNNSYLQVRNEPINEFGVTAGMGGFIGPSLLYSLSLEGGSRGTTKQSLIKENYLQATITFSYRDMFLSKGRRYD